MLNSQPQSPNAELKRFIIKPEPNSAPENARLGMELLNSSQPHPSASSATGEAKKQP